MSDEPNASHDQLIEELTEVIIAHGCNRTERHAIKVAEAITEHFQHGQTTASGYELVERSSRPGSDWISTALAGERAQVDCICGETINTDMPNIEPEARAGVLWHGNSQGGGHASDVDISVIAAE